MILCGGLAPPLGRQDRGFSKFLGGNDNYETLNEG